MSNLYELSQTVEQIVQEVISAEGELSTELEARLNAVSLDFKDKAGNIARWVKNIEANEPGIEAEITRLQRRMKVQNNIKDRLEKYLHFCMENANLNKLELGTITLSIDKNPPSVAIDSEEDLPSRYIRIEQTKSINKQEIGKDLKAGKVVSGAHLVTDKTHLKIR